MFEVITIDFNGYKKICLASDSKDLIKTAYKTYIKRCLYGSPDIQEIRITKNGETVTAFINWRR